MPLTSVCVYCGSRNGADPRYAEEATALGHALATRGWRLVYGAGDVGLMGAVALAAKAAGGLTLGVIPQHLVAREALSGPAPNHVVTENMHERKKVMFMNSDAVVVLPGGAGSLDEFFEVPTWAQLGLHAKPIFLLDVAGYWQPLLALIDHVIDQGFADPSLRGLVRTAEGTSALVAGLGEALETRSAAQE
ncbi:TIGR00730 family Rossman fold protein [Rhodosalinus sp. FB01]|uniref:LOG family protein n=1 Tax=Rhodosalinus sp. FB01 TaxID=3239194 RepID=UPI003523BA21